MARVRVHQTVNITLPEEALQKLGVAEGGELEVEVVKDGVLLKPLGEGDAATAEKLEADLDVEEEFKAIMERIEESQGPGTTERVWAEFKKLEEKLKNSSLE